MQADETPKYCENCAFCRVPDNGIQFARCVAPQAGKQEGTADRFVSAKFDKKEDQYCSTMRLVDSRCSPAARWFEPKQDAAVAA